MDIRNIAIIAHVDHGKTTLVDAMLAQSGMYRENQAVQERAMDSNELEQERGITILAKCTAVPFKGGRLNIVDTPGHADFGGEVERILSMVDGCVLLVDSAEGPLPQTKFVVGKALKLGLKPIVVINKIDRADAQADVVLDSVFDLFVSLDADEEQLEFPILYAAGRDGWADTEIEGPRKDLEPLFKTIIDHVPTAKGDKDAPFSMLATIQDADNFLGRILTGRVATGTVTPNMQVKGLNADGQVETGRIAKILSFNGLERTAVESAEAGDIISIAGLSETTVSNTVAAMDVDQALPATPIDPPTLAMTFSVNTSPYAGTEGKKLTSRQIADRLYQEAERNVSIRVSETDDKDAFEVAGRGELQLGVIIETMRREGFELSISRPRVLLKEENGQTLEPYENITIDVDEEFSGAVMEALSTRKAILAEMKQDQPGKTRLIFDMPARGLIGFYGSFLTMTRGTGLLHRAFSGYGEFKGAISGRRNGVLTSNGKGEAVAYSLQTLEDRGELFIGHGDKVYQGMIIGEHSRENDLEVNPLKAKQLTNMRASGKDDAIKLSPPRQMSLEESLAYIQDDELVEVTPTAIRLRKIHLDPNERKRAAKKAA